MAVEGDGTLCLARGACVANMASLVKICTGRFLPAHRSWMGCRCLPLHHATILKSTAFICRRRGAVVHRSKTLPFPTITHRAGGPALPAKDTKTRKHNEPLWPVHFQNVHQGDDCRDQEE